MGLLEEAGALEVLEVERKTVEEKIPRRKKAAVSVSEKTPDWNAFIDAWKRREAEQDLPPLTSVTAMKRGTSPPEKKGAARGAEIGIACHEALERLNFAAPKLPPLEEDARSIVEGFLESEAFGELRDAEILARELPFLVPQGEQGVQGFIDVVYRSGDDVYIGDYKTDVEMQPEDYRLAKDVYTRAVEGALGVKVAGFRLFYLRHGKVVTL